jgi:hypothetical protein
MSLLSILFRLDSSIAIDKKTTDALLAILEELFLKHSEIGTLKACMNAISFLMKNRISFVNVKHDYLDRILTAALDDDVHDLIIVEALHVQQALLFRSILERGNSNTHFFLLTDASVLSAPDTVVVIQMVHADVNQITAFGALCTSYLNCFIAINGTTIRDMFGVTVVPTTKPIILLWKIKFALTWCIFISVYKGPGLFLYFLMRR